MGDVFEAIATPARRAILDELVERDGQTLFELCTRLIMKHHLGLTRQAVSQHLAVLESAGLVSTVRQGRYKLHYLHTAPLRQIVARWLRTEQEADQRGKPTMHIVVSSIFVDDREKALAFYTTTLGFIKQADVPMGPHRWLTVVAPDAPDGPELVLEPDSHPAVGPFKRALVSDGIPWTSFGVDDVRAEYARLSAAGVRFTQPPVEMGPVTTAVLDDTCGNLIQLAQRR
jgi:DNA-binding transcriptional ArsR family regulator/catechol 2,3-dioxygenase-like lactoylglutathione lyase family enzyme